MAQIYNIIPVQNFELIRDRIALILATEVNNQFVLSGNDDINCDVWLERSTPFDKIENPTINVSLSSDTFDSKNQTDVRSTAVFNIDCFTNSKTTDVQDGDQKSMFKLHRILGICRAILENQIFKTLNFTPPFICRTSIDSINIANPNGNDATNQTMGRLAFTVVFHEETPALTANLVAQWYTTVKLDTTNQGYVYYGSKMADFNKDFNKDYLTL